MEGPKPYISLAEAGKQSGYSAEYIRQLCVKGKIKGEKIGKSWLITQEELDRFMGKAAVETPTFREILGSDLLHPALDAGSDQSKTPAFARVGDGAGVGDGIKKANISQIKYIFAAGSMAAIFLAVVVASAAFIMGKLDLFEANISQNLANSHDTLNRQMASLAKKLDNNLAINQYYDHRFAEINNKLDVLALASKEEIIYSGPVYSSDSNEIALTNDQVLSALRTAIAQGLPSDLAEQLKGPKGDPGPALSYIPNSGSVFGTTAPTAQPSNAGTIGSATYLSSKEFYTDKLTVTGTSTLTSLNISGNSTVSGDLTVSGTSTLNGLVITNSLLTSNAQSTFTKVPTLAHVFTPSWPLGTSNASDGTVYINPASSIADGNLLSAAVGGSIKFLVDSEGDIYGNNLILTGSTSQGATTIAGNLTVQDNTTLGDAVTDSVTFNANVISNLTFKKADPTIIFDVTTAIDTDYWAGAIDDADGVDDDLFQIGKGTTPGTTPYLTVRQDGNVGIGTTNPTNRLYITSASGDTGVRLEGSATNSAYINFRDAAGANTNTYFGTENSTGGNLAAGTSAYSTVLATANARSIQFATNNAVAMTILSGGNVGIGTTNPLTRLHLSGTTAATTKIQIDDTASGTLTYTIQGDAGRGVFTSRGGDHTWGHKFTAAANLTGISSEQIMGQFLGTFAPTSGTAKFIGLDISPTINQTGTATGDYTALQIRPTITAATGTNKFLIHAGTAASPDMFVLNGAGNVGIGTATPGSKLDITTAGLAATQTTSSGLALVNTTAATAIAPVQISPAIRWSGFGWKTDVTAASQAVDFRSYVVPVQGTANPTGYLSFGSSVNGAAYSDGQMVLTTAGNVGIGVTNPGSPLHTAYNGQGLNTGIRIESTLAGSARAWELAVQTGGKFGIYDASASAVPRVTIDTSGNVGIGTTGPGTKLHVESTGGGLIRINGTNGSISTGIEFYDSGTREGYVATNASAAITGGLANAMVFATHQVTGGAIQLAPIEDATKGLTILTSGNVGIGTTGPGSQLTVSYGGVGQRVSNGLVMTSDTDSKSNITMELASNTVGDANNTLRFERSRGTHASRLATVAGDYLGTINFNGWTDGINNSVQINALADTGWGLTGADSPGALTFSTVPDGSGTLAERMRITSAGNVGIGTTGPSSKLDVTTAGLAATQTTSSGLALVNTTAATAIAPVQISPAIRWSGFGWKTDVTAASQAVDFRSYVVPVQGTANPTGYLSFGSSVNGAAYSDGQMVLTTAGNVGIGTTGPGYKLDIQNGGGTTSLGQNIQNLSGQLVLGVDNLNGNGLFPGGAAYAGGIGTISNTAFQLLTNNSIKMTILSGGNVGIGTTNPQKRLEVYESNNSAVSSATFWTPAFGGLRIRNPDTTLNTVAGIQFVPGTDAVAGIGAIQEAVNLGALAFFTGGGGTANSVPERMRITSGGNVGIGVTSPVAKLQVVGSSTKVNDGSGWTLKVDDSQVAAAGVGGGILFSGKKSAAGAGGNFAAISGIKENATDTNEQGALVFHTTPVSGLLTERMRIDSTGNVGIGTTNPSTGKLQVVSSSGTARVVSTGTYNKVVSVRNENTDATAERDATINFAVGGADEGYLSFVKGSATNATQDGRFEFAARDGNTRNMIMSMLPTGNVGIGTTNPGRRFDVAVSSVGTQVARIRNSGGSIGDHGMLVEAGPNSSDTSTTLIAFYDAGENTAQGSITRNGAAAVAYNTTSDRRLKENIVDTNRGLDILMQIPVNDFNFISESGKTTQGFIAQELYDYYPEAVHVGGDDPAKNPWQIDYGRLTPLLVKSVQELDVRSAFGLQAVKNNAAEKIESGMLVVIEGEAELRPRDGMPSALVRIAKPGDTALYGILDNSQTAEGSLAANDYGMVATSGSYSKVKVDNSSGPIKPGDFLQVSNTTPGFAAKADGSGAVIGMALASMTSETGEVPVSIRLDVKLNVAGGPNGTIISEAASDINMNSFSLLNVKSIASISGKWSIDENGVMIAAEVRTEKLCLGQTCVDESMLRQILGNMNLLPAPDTATASGEPPPSQGGVTLGAEPAPEPVSEPPVEEPVVVQEPVPEATAESNPAVEPAPEPMP